MVILRRSGMLFTILASTLSLPATASVTVAVIDSGMDYKHRDLSPRAWANPGETPDNQLDDDGNGFADDVYGWNFAENNNQVIDYKYINTFSEDCYEFFRVQGRIISGTATDRDRSWYDAKRGDAAFIQELATFANFVHGSHVAGIASASRSIEQLLAVKIIPTKTPGMNIPVAESIRTAIAGRESTDPFTKMMMQMFLNMIVDQQVGVIVKAGEYVARAGADIANGSFGVSHNAAKNAVKSLLPFFLGREPTDEEINEYANYMIDRINEKVRTMLQTAPNTLFVFAAGNDGTDNDTQAMAPANVGASNSISVAATLGLGSLASFSNFGAAKVDVAAPGVVINSTVPGDRYLEMSGTSMAAPYVAQVAALVKDANPALKPEDIKRIIIETVDKKSFLVGKVRSAGTVNLARAVAAAHASRDQSLDQAIRQATNVPDAQEERVWPEGLDDKFIVPTPLPSLISWQ